MAALAAACSRGPTSPTTVITPPTAPPTITCPADVTAQTLNGTPVAVQFDAPAVSGGAVPVKTTCSSEAGATFPVGITDVSCTAVDGQQRQASCSFAVKVVEAPHITKNRFLAFGDSITRGVDNEACLFAPSGGWAPFSPFRHGAYAFAAKPYPLALEELLQARYPGEKPTVANSGVSGETAVAGDGRFSGVLATQHPEVVLLLEGINDINQRQGDAVSDVETALRSMVRHAKEAGVEVFLSTLLPQRPGACKAYDETDGVDDISDANAAINYVANEQGVPLVDMHKVFSGQETTLLGFDGLHPNQAGYQKMAEVFLEAIKGRLEVK